MIGRAGAELGVALVIAGSPKPAVVMALTR